jgi:UDP-N-acetylglucosamine 2-epimerase (non-hydrolysing)
MAELADGPDAVMVQGDTSTVAAFALASRHCGVPLIHLEAGLRSYNECSAEEHHRRIASVTATLHLAPTNRAAAVLRREGVEPARVHVVGNPGLDGLRLLGVPRRSVHERNGVLLTAHRAGTVDVPDRLLALVAIAGALVRDIGGVRFPVHPRTRARLDAAALTDVLVRAGVELVDPLSWTEMVEAVASSSLVVTDSGGLQEEASWFGVPAVVLRRSTPRWEGVEAGIAVLAGVDPELALRAAARLTSPEEQARVARVACVYGDGHTAERIADLLDDPAVIAGLRLVEPDFTDGRLPC